MIETDPKYSALRLTDGLTIGDDLLVSDVNPGDVFETRQSKSYPYPNYGRIHKVNRTTFGWTDGQMKGKPGEEQLWVRKCPIKRLQWAAILRGSVVHVVDDPSLGEFVARVPVPNHWMPA